MAALFNRARPLAAVGAVAVTLAGHRRGPVWNEQKKDFVALKVIGAEQHTHNTRKVTFATQEPLAGQGIVNVQVRAKLGGTSTCCGCCKCGPNCGCPKKACGCCGCCKCGEDCKCPKQAGDGIVSRMYNPLSVQAGDRFTLLVKKYEGSLMGTHIHGLKVGDTLEVKGPNTQKKLEVGKYSDYAFIAGGTGITPLIQAAEQVLHKDMAKVTFVTLNKSDKDQLLVAELETLRKRYPGRLKIEHVVERNGALLPPKESFAKLLPPPSSNLMLMVCGRGEMTAAIAGPKTEDFKQGDLGGILKELGYASTQVWKV